MSRIALVLIEQMVKNGQIDADDIGEMCDKLPEKMREAVQAAWVEGSVPDGQAEFKPPLRVVD